MKNTISRVIVLIIVVIAFFVFKDVNNKANDSTDNNSSIEVSVNTFEEEVINSDKKVLVDFYATWCGPCKEFAPILEEVVKENDNLKLVKVDVDKNEELVSRYGIKAMPTLVVIENGKEITRSVGLLSKDTLIHLIEGKIKTINDK